MGLDAMILVFWVFSFMPTFPLSSFTRIERIFISSSLSARRNINNLRYADDATLIAESEEELKNLDEGEQGEWKSRLKN